MEVSARKLIWAGGMVAVICRSQLTGVWASPPTTGGRRLGRADAVIAQEGQGDPESFAQFWVTSRPGMQAEAAALRGGPGGSCDFVWFQGGEPMYMLVGSVLEARCIG